MQRKGAFPLEFEEKSVEIKTTKGGKATSKEGKNSENVGL